MPLTNTPRIKSLSTAIITAIVAASCVNPVIAKDVRLGVDKVPARAEGAVRLATYNLLNLFDDVNDLSLVGRNDDCHSYDKTVRAKPEAQCAAVADAIRRIDADIIGLQEIESYDALIQFREKHLKGLGYKYVYSVDVGQERGIEQAVLSRFPIKRVTVWPGMDLGGVHPEMYGDRKNWQAGEPILYRRSPLHVRIEVPAERAGGEAYELDLFVIHHKSGRYNNYWREKETQAVIGLVQGIQKEDPGRNIAVLGDFNAMPDAKSITMYTDAGLSHVIPDRSPEDARTQTHESGRAIDFILVNEALRAEIVEGSAFVLGTPVRPEGADWRKVDPPVGYASDHLPVVVDITPRDG